MNADDRALADLIEREATARAIEGLQWAPGQTIENAVAFIASAVRNDRVFPSADRLEAFHAKPLVADMTRALPGGTMDDSTFEAIEEALDRADAPSMDGSRWLTLPERISALRSESVKPAAGEIEQIAKDMEHAVANSMAWIDHSEAYEFARRLRAALQSDHAKPVEEIICGLTEVQRAAIKESIFIAGDWVLTTHYENHPDIMEGLSEDIADPVSGILTTFGKAVRVALCSPSEVGGWFVQRLVRLRDRLIDTGAKRISRSGAAHEIDAILAALQSPPLARMVAIDEEIEAKHPGWMTGCAIPAEYLERLADRHDELQRAADERRPGWKRDPKTQAKDWAPGSMWTTHGDIAADYRRIAKQIAAMTPPVVEGGRREAASEIVARALCKHFGEDPDALTAAATPLGDPADYPLWMLYLPEARPIADAILALTPVEGAGLERFADDVTDVHSRIIIVHQLRASAEIQDRQTKKETGWADTNDRATLMREAADAIERLALSTPATAQGDVREALREARFLCDRLDELDFSVGMEEFTRLHIGHVDPSHSRLKAALATLGTPHEG